MLPYRSHPCISSQRVSVSFKVCLFLCMHAWQYCTCTGVWSHYESQPLGQITSAHSANLHQCALRMLCVCLHLCAHMYLHYIMYACMCCVSLIMCLHLYACAYLRLCFRAYLHTVAVFTSQGSWAPQCLLVTITTCRYNEAKENVDAKTRCINWVNRMKSVPSECYWIFLIVAAWFCRKKKFTLVVKFWGILLQ